MKIYCLITFKQVAKKILLSRKIRFSTLRNTKIWLLETSINSRKEYETVFSVEEFLCCSIFIHSFLFIQPLLRAYYVPLALMYETIAINSFSGSTSGAGLFPIPSVVTELAFTNTMLCQFLLAFKITASPCFPSLGSQLVCKMFSYM